MKDLQETRDIHTGPNSKMPAGGSGSELMQGANGLPHIGGSLRAARLALTESGSTRGDGRGEKQMDAGNQRKKMAIRRRPRRDERR